jgi:hypothetical protein
VVFNAHTGLVEGILVRGESDYESNSVDEKNCMRVKKCVMEECRGEDVQKIPPILISHWRLLKSSLRSVVWKRNMKGLSNINWQLALY